MPHLIDWRAASFRRPYGKSWRSIVAFADGVKHGGPRRDAAFPQCRRNAAISVAMKRWDGRPNGCRHRGRLAWHCAFPPLCWPPRSRCRNRRRQRSSRSRSFTADYAVSFLGLTVARSTVVSRFGATSYCDRRLDQKRRPCRVLRQHDRQDRRLRQDRQGRASAPTAIRSTTSTARRPRRRRCNSPRAMSSRLPTRRRCRRARQDWVPVGAKDLLAVADPISATLIEAKDARSVCGRTIKAFDGEIRADLTLSYVDTEPVSIGGLRGRGGHLPGAFQAGRRLSSRQQVAPVPVDQKPDHAEVCTARQNRHICADPRDGRHQGRHVHDPRQAA